MTTDMNLQARITRWLTRNLGPEEKPAPSAPHWKTDQFGTVFYGCGNYPMVGDLVEFGSRGTQLLVDRVNYDVQPGRIVCNGQPYGHEAAHLMRLLARHPGNAVVHPVVSSGRARR